MYIHTHTVMDRHIDMNREIKMQIALGCVCMYMHVSEGRHAQTEVHQYAPAGTHRTHAHAYAHTNRHARARAHTHTGTASHLTISLSDTTADESVPAPTTRTASSYVQINIQIPQASVLRHTSRANAGLRKRSQNHTDTHRGPQTQHTFFASVTLAVSPSVTSAACTCRSPCSTPAPLPSLS